MHRRSIELLRLIRDKEHEKFVQYFTSAYMPDESLISNLVLLILHVSDGSAQSAKEMGINHRQVMSRIVTSAGDVMRTYLEKNGDVACRELKVLCKNKKPIHDDMGYDKGKTEELVYSWLSLEDVLGGCLTDDWNPNRLDKRSRRELNFQNPIAKRQSHAQNWFTFSLR